MFKNAMFYRANSNLLTQVVAGEAAAIDKLSEQIRMFGIFKPCRETELESSGFTNAALTGELFHVVGKRVLFCLKKEKKNVPAKAVKEKLANEVAAIEREQNRTPKKAEQAEIKEKIIEEIARKTVPAPSLIFGYFDSDLELFVIDTASSGSARDFLSLIGCCILDLGINEYPLVDFGEKCLDILESPEDYPDISYQNECTLTKSGQELKEKQTSTLDKIHLICDLSFELTSARFCIDEKHSATINDDLSLRRLDFDFSDCVHENLDDKQQQFDADFVLASSALNDVILLVIKLFSND